jgi:glycine cleavage system aminomethyltransferase T
MLEVVVDTSLDSLESSATRWCEKRRDLSPTAAVRSCFTTTKGDHVKRFVVAVGACLLLGGAACSDSSFIDEVTIVNDTDYSANVDVTGKARDGWLGLTVSGPQSRTTVEEVIDQGEVWIFRFDYVGRYEEEVEISRGELEGKGWTIEVPRSFEQRLRDLDLPPPP